MDAAPRPPDARDASDTPHVPPPAPLAGAAGRQFPCEQCGATLRFEPGTGTLKCPYCGHENRIPGTADADATGLDPAAAADRPGASAVAEQDYQAELTRLGDEAPSAEAMVVRCGRCGAETTLAANVAADRCPFCGAGIVAVAEAKRLLKPRSLLPFRVSEAEARAAFATWIGSLWFAPGGLKRYAHAQSGLQGVYVPYWTYDCRADTAYTGQRGDDYWTTESYTTMVNGRAERQTRQVRRTRWSYASGAVRNRFDDVLVMASGSLPRKYADALEPWDLAGLTPYRDEYLSGFRAEVYQVDLAGGFEVARGRMQPVIEATIRDDIGGDHQQISSARTRYSDITYKHLLLPVWLSAYRYRDRVFRFLVNARTGEVQGERPYSALKIALAVLLAVLIAAAVWWFIQGRGAR